MKTVHRFCTPLMMLNSFTGICHVVLKPNWLPLNEVSWVKNLDVSDLKCLEKSSVTLFLAAWVFLSVVNNPSISCLIQTKFDFNEQKVNQEGLCPSTCHCHSSSFYPLPLSGFQNTWQALQNDLGKLIELTH